MIRWLNILWFALQARWSGKSKISPGAKIKFPKHLSIGRKVIIRTGAIVDAPGRCTLQLGDEVNLNQGVYLGAFGSHFIVGDRTQFNRNALVDGRGSVRIGKDVLVGPGAQLISYQHRFADRDQPINRQGLDLKEIVVEDDVWIGAGAIVLAGVTLGRGSIVGAGAVVTKSCPPFSILGGVPARVIGQRGADGDAPSVSEGPAA
ncbi:MAG: acyltransferase [Azonexus sp.]|nr:acyltransferase [Azonexus sp.]